METWWQVAIDEGSKLLVAVVLGGAIGFERELLDKPAGLRTNILIAVGSTLVTIMSVRMAGAEADPGRIAAQIVTGVGFLGAGSIIQSRASVVGLTTAATIWAVAGIGIAIGAGDWPLAVLATVVILSCLTLLRPLEGWRLWRRERLHFQVALERHEALPEVMSVLARADVAVEQTSVTRTPAGLDMNLTCVAKPHSNKELLASLVSINGVVSLSVSE